MIQGPVAGGPINANPGLNFDLSFLLFRSKAFYRLIFFILYSTSNHCIAGKKTKLNFLFKHSYLILNFALTLGYLNPALNIPAQG